MKKRIFLTTTVNSIAILLFSTFIANAQPSQYYIGSATKSELGTAIRMMSDGSSIIAGYSYDLTTPNSKNSDDVNNADMLLMRVKNGVILWQVTWGGSNNDLINDMVITANSDIVIVGTVGITSPYSNNTAAIYRFNSSTGALLYQNYVRDNNTSDLGGEVYYGVCELGNHNIVAVGSHDNRPNYADGLITTFDPSLTIIRNDVMQGSQLTDLFNGVAKDPSNPNNVFISGDANSAGRIMSYTPPTYPTSGIVTWEQWYTYSYNTATDIDFTKIHISGNELLVDGWVSDDCCGATDVYQAIYRTDASTGNTVSDLRVLDYGLPYANSLTYYPITPEIGISVQNPDVVARDPANNVTSPMLNSIVAEISLSAPTVDFSRKFGLPGYHSIVDIDVSVSMLMTGGVSGDPLSFGGKDIYYVESSSMASPGPGDCSTSDANLNIATPQVTIGYINETPTSFSVVSTIPNFSATATNLGIVLVCAGGQGGGGNPTQKAAPSGIIKTNMVPQEQVSLFPNPTDDISNLTFSLAVEQKVEIIVVDALGRIVKSAYDQVMAAGTHTLEISTSDLSAGIYNVRIQMGNNVVTQKLSVVK